MTTNLSERTTPEPPQGRDKGLAAGSVGLLSMVSLGLASVAPAYSITVTLGLVTLVVGHLAPAALLVGFVPILCTAYAFRELNRVMPDCGTNFVWITRAFGPWSGWIFGNWIPQIATLIAMTALSQVGATSLLSLVGLSSYAARTVPVTLLGLLLLAVATAVAYRGVQLSAAIQNGMVAIQFVALIGFGIAALAHHHAATPSLAWVNPLGFHGTGPFAESVLLCLFIYWGWDSALTVNEEARDRTRAPGRAAVISTVTLLGTYLFTAVAAISFAGTGSTGLGLGNQANAADVLATLAPAALGGPVAKVVQLAVCLSAVAGLLTCVVSTARPNVSVASHGAMPRIFARVHPRFRTPTFATLFSGVLAAVLLTSLTAASPSFLSDAILSIGLMVCSYYGATAFACVWHFRRELRGSAHALVFKGLLPLAGGLMMLAAFLRSAHDMLAPGYGSTSFDGVGGVFLLGMGSMVFGIAVTALMRVLHPGFFRNGRTTVTDLIITED
ncbi:APC family permease [Streptacidiphilus sp. P02-A3a]|uniref:APC family permease n=1 Tax=Streptacidiphilus sp. P02-A3a TaxID=2704468 RepID=UPI0015F921D8|nr:APC family permease [Streptacidiphilus sp. P02-A3a]QMU71276.1 APC family permease [Streptacidiphilus sp. P02-A3a]